MCDCWSKTKLNQLIESLRYDRFDCNVLWLCVTYMTLSNGHENVGFENWLTMSHIHLTMTGYLIGNFLISWTWWCWQYAEGEAKTIKTQRGMGRSRDRRVELCNVVKWRHKQGSGDCQCQVHSRSRSQVGNELHLENIKVGIERLDEGDGSGRLVTRSGRVCDRYLLGTG